MKKSIFGLLLAFIGLSFAYSSNANTVGGAMINDVFVECSFDIESIDVVSLKISQVGLAEHYCWNIERIPAFYMAKQVTPYIVKKEKARNKGDPQTKPRYQLRQHNKLVKELYTDLRGYHSIYGLSSTK